MKASDALNAEKQILQREFCIDCPRREAQDALLRKAAELLRRVHDQDDPPYREIYQWLKDGGFVEDTRKAGMDK